MSFSVARAGAEPVRAPREPLGTALGPVGPGSTRGAADPEVAGSAAVGRPGAGSPTVDPSAIHFVARTGQADGFSTPGTATSTLGSVGAGSSTPGSVGAGSSTAGSFGTGTSTPGSIGPGSRIAHPEMRSATAGTDEGTGTGLPRRTGTDHHSDVRRAGLAGAGSPTDRGDPQAVAGDAGGPGRPPAFEVRLANFEGPFDLLLSLISKHQLDVTEVALSRVTDEFIAHIRALGSSWDLGQATEFLVVAATLLDLKAARLLPSAEVADEEDLALLEARDLLFARLLQYRAYKQMAAHFRVLERAQARRFPRAVPLEPRFAELMPEVLLTVTPEQLARIAADALRPKPRPMVSIAHVHAPRVSIREHASILRGRIARSGQSSFRALTQDCQHPLELVARFLAVLELYREGAVAFDQMAPLGELWVRWTGGTAVEEPAGSEDVDEEYGW